MQVLEENYTLHHLYEAADQDALLREVGDAIRGIATDGHAGAGAALMDALPNLEIIEENFAFTGQWAHEPNPLVPANMVPTQEGVRRTGADLGVCFDGDADRCMIVDDRGALIGCDHLTALLCGHFLKQQPGGAIVYDLRSSKIVPETIAALGGKPTVSKVGHVNMKALMREVDGVFGGELSGHFYFKHNSFADSGAIALAAVLSVLGESDKSMTELIAPFRKYPHSGEINFINEDTQATMDGLRDRYGPDAANVLELDGVTIDCFDRDGWWFNVRPSNTEPRLRLNAEARDPANLERMVAELTPQLGTPVEEH